MVDKVEVTRVVVATVSAVRAVMEKEVMEVKKEVEEKEVDSEVVVKVEEKTAVHVALLYLYMDSMLSEMFDFAIVVYYHLQLV